MYIIENLETKSLDINDMIDTFTDFYENRNII